MKRFIGLIFATVCFLGPTQSWATQVVISSCPWTVPSDWNSSNNFGFITSDVKSLDLFDKMLELAEIIRLGRARISYPTEFLVYVVKDVLAIYWREKAKAF